LTYVAHAASTVLARSEARGRVGIDPRRNRCFHSSIGKVRRTGTSARPDEPITCLGLSQRSRGRPWRSPRESPITLAAGQRTVNRARWWR